MVACIPTAIYHKQHHHDLDEVHPDRGRAVLHVSFTLQTLLSNQCLLTQYSSQQDNPSHNSAAITARLLSYQLSLVGTSTEHLPGCC